jgi:osmotically-inducible protein OsmY
MRAGIRTFALALGVLLFIAQPVLSNDLPNDLQDRVMAELARYYVTPFDITIKDEGFVIIEGKVPSYWDKRNVFAIVSRVPGVRKISNRLLVDTDLVADNIIKSEIENELERSRMIIDPSDIEVSVTNGVVLLRGTVHFRREAVVAEDIASWQRGVKGVVNEITVLPPEEAVSDENLTVALNNMIRRFFPLEGKDMYVKVNNGKVILTGTVRTLWARNEIEKEVRRIQGVREVDNRLEIARRVLTARK